MDSQIVVCRAVWDTNSSPLRGDSACWVLSGAAALGSLFEGAGTRIGSSQPILVTEGVSHPFLGHSPSQKSNRFLTAPSGRGPRLPSTTYIAKLQFVKFYTPSGSARPVGCASAHGCPTRQETRRKNPAGRMTAGGVHSISSRNRGSSWRGWDDAACGWPCFQSDGYAHG